MVLLALKESIEPGYKPRKMYRHKAVVQMPKAFDSDLKNSYSAAHPEIVEDINHCEWGTRINLMSLSIQFVILLVVYSIFY